MNLLVMREPERDNAIKGEAFLDGGYFCFTLERKEVLCPSGIYVMELYFSPHLQEEVLLLKGVPGRSMIEVHYGSFPANSNGCILVGYREGDGMISKSRDALRDLVKLVKEDSEPSKIQLMDP